MSEQPPVVSPSGFSHVRLTVTDIRRSKHFYSWLLGRGPRSDFSDQIDDPTVRNDPDRRYGGCSFAIGDQILGLRPLDLPAASWSGAVCCPGVS